MTLSITFLHHPRVMMLLYTLFTYDVIYNACLSTQVHVCSIHHDMNRAWMDCVCSPACSTFMYLSLCSSNSSCDSRSQSHTLNACYTLGMHTFTLILIVAMIALHIHIVTWCAEMRVEWVSVLLCWLRGSMLMWWRNENKLVTLWYECAHTYTRQESHHTSMHHTTQFIPHLMFLWGLFQWIWDDSILLTSHPLCSYVVWLHDSPSCHAHYVHMMIAEYGKCSLRWAMVGGCLFMKWMNCT